MSGDIDSKQQALSDFATHVNPGKARVLAGVGLDVLEWERDGAIVRDVDGREYIDCITGFGVFNVGRRNPRVVEALRRGLDEGLDLGDFMLMSKPKADLARKLAEVCQGLGGVMFGAGGGEAVDFALKLARAVTGRPGVLSTSKAYHGHTGFALSAAGRPQFREPFEPLLEHFRQLPFGDLAAMRDAVDDSVGAIIVEPVQGEGGINIPPEGYLMGLRELCDGKQRTLIVDEVQSGMGRTGKLWAFQHWNVVPDMITIGKAISGGIYPLSATVFRGDYLAFLDQRPFVHLSTFGGSDLGCVVALEVFAILEEENLIERAAQRGEQFQNGFHRLRGIYPQLLDEVRCKGLMMALRYKSDVGARIAKELAHRGVLCVMSGTEPSLQRVMPSLVISEEQVDKVLRAFEDSFAAVMEDSG
jgi:putrescine aminotransferase